MKSFIIILFLCVLITYVKADKYNYNYSFENNKLKFIGNGIDMMTFLDNSTLTFEHQGVIHTFNPVESIDGSQSPQNCCCTRPDGKCSVCCTCTGNYACCGHSVGCRCMPLGGSCF